MNNFNKIHPEYEARLALFKKPEERMRTFLIDELWDKWNDMPKLWKDQMRDDFGREFQEKFIDKETRSYDAIAPETMQIWLKLMGGDPPGTLSAPVAPLELAPRDIAYRAQNFYDTRMSYFPDWFQIQETFYGLPEKSAQRKAFLAKNPELVDYWDWRRDWFHRNPEVVPYLTDQEYEFQYASEEQIQKVRENQPYFTWDEWQQVLPSHLRNLVLDNIYDDENIPEGAQNQLEEIALQLGVDYDHMLQLIEGSIQ